jgi:hypothetical protein
MHLQCVFEMFIDFHNSSLITTTVAVIWCAENCHYVSIVTPIVTLESERVSNYVEATLGIHASLILPPSPADVLLRPR